MTVKAIEVLGSGSSCAVSIHQRLLRPHAPISQAHCDFTPLRLYATSSLCESAQATPRRSLLSLPCFPMHAADPYPGGPSSPPVVLAR